MFHDNQKIEITLLLSLGILSFLVIFLWTRGKKRELSMEENLQKFKKLYIHLLALERTKLSKFYADIPTTVSADEKRKLKMIENPVDMIRTAVYYTMFGEDIIQATDINELDNKFKNLNATFVVIEKDPEVSDELSQIQTLITEIQKRGT